LQTRKHSEKERSKKREAMKGTKKSRDTCAESVRKEQETNKLMIDTKLVKYLYVSIGSFD